MEITLCGKQNLYGETHNNSRITRVLPGYHFVNRKANQIGIEILSLNLYPANNTELRHLKQHRSVVYTLLQLVHENAILFFGFEIAFISISHDILPLGTSGG